MAAQGQSAFTSSADCGAYTAAEDIGTTNLSADNPADSPYITACGGTTLPGTTYLSGPDGTATATTTAQRIWGWDYLWPADRRRPPAYRSPTAAEAAVVGSGGGFSLLEPDPSYQQGVSGTDNLPRGAVPDPDRRHHRRPGADRAHRVELQPHPAGDRGRRHRPRDSRTLPPTVIRRPAT